MKNKFKIIFPDEIKEQNKTKEKIKIPKLYEYSSILCPNKILSYGNPVILRPDREDCNYVYYWCGIYYCEDEIEFV